VSKLVLTDVSRRFGGVTMVAHLRRQPPSSAERACIVPGQVVQRADLGEHWDYTVRPADSGLLLRVTARPHEVFEVNERVWLEVDPRQMARIE
jgi:hypothetical protein